eukprot:UN13563
MNLFLSSLKTYILVKIEFLFLQAT